MKNKLRLLLAPFALLYHWVTSFRNHLYDIGNKRSFEFDVFTIGVGNLRVGGTGKTPFSEYLIERFIKENISTAFLSRGYGRKTKGFLDVTAQSKAKEVGDEPLQVANKFSNLTVAVCEQRIIGIPTLLAGKPDIKCIVLDDVYQHRSVKPTITILLSTFSDPFYDDYILPMGNLRESKKGAKRADAVVITNSPKNISKVDKNEVVDKIRLYTKPDTPIYFSRVNYGDIQLVKGDKSQTENCIVISGIANNEVFITQVKNNYTVLKAFTFKDHYNFKEKEVKEIINFAHQKEGLTVITTEKDWQRLKAFENLIGDSKLSFYVYPIRFELENETEFWNKTLAKIEKS